MPMLTHVNKTLNIVCCDIIFTGFIIFQPAYQNDVNERVSVYYIRNNRSQ